MAYTHDVQRDCARNAVRCYTSEKAPSMKQLELVYGNDAAESWLEIQLQDLSEFAGCKDKLTTRQLEQTAKMICANYGWLNAAEIQLFFARFKAGMYGKFYGVVDPLKIMDAVKDFLKQRNLELDLYEREKAAIEASNREKIIDGYNEYKKLKKLAEQGDEDAIKKLQPPQ